MDPFDAHVHIVPNVSPVSICVQPRKPGGTDRVGGSNNCNHMLSGRIIDGLSFRRPSMCPLDVPRWIIAYILLCGDDGMIASVAPVRF